MQLVLNTYGISLNRDNEGFVISSSEGRQRIPASAVKSIQISKGAQITSDAVMLAVENEIEILFMDRSGNPIGRVWSPKYGSISTIRKGQVNFTFSKDAVTWIKKIITTKIENCQALILTLKTEDFRSRNITESALSKLEDYRNKIKRLDGEIVHDISATLRGWEGQASKVYFKTLNEFIPEKYRFESRTQRPGQGNDGQNQSYPQPETQTTPGAQRRICPSRDSEHSPESSGTSPDVWHPDHGDNKHPVRKKTENESWEQICRGKSLLWEKRLHCCHFAPQRHRCRAE